MWTYELKSCNSISILRDGQKVAEIISEDSDSPPEDFAVAEFIVAACNEKEAK